MRKSINCWRGAVVAVFWPLTVIGLVFGLEAGEVLADNDPRDYLPAPDGTKAFSLYYQHTWGDELYAQGERVASDYRLRSHLSILKGTIYRQFKDELVVMQLAVPFANADLDWNSGNLSQDASGIGDIIMLAGFWPYHNSEKRLWWGVSGWLIVPSGDYDENKSVNVGSNRWAFKGETNVTWGIIPGLFLEGTVSLENYTDNDSYAGSILEQDPVVTLEGHLSKDLSQTVNVSLDYFFHSGGETTLAGVAQDNSRRDHALQATVAFPVGDGWFTRLVYRNDFVVHNGAETQTAGFRLIKPF